MTLRARLLDAMSAPSCPKRGVTGVTGVTSKKVTPQVAPQVIEVTPVTSVTCEKTLVPKRCVTGLVTADSADRRDTELFIAADGTVWLSECLRDAYDERAAIFEYDAGMSHEQASHAAWKGIMKSEGIIVHD
jgi:hypothetical protein